MLQQYNPKNENILIYVNGRLCPRGEARVSVFDSAVQGGDAVWEGIRVYNGRVFPLDRIADAKAHMESNAQVGKIVVRVA